MKQIEFKEIKYEYKNHFILCKLFKELKEEYHSKLAISQPVHFNQKEYKKFCTIAKENQKFNKKEI